MRILTVTLVDFFVHLDQGHSNVKYFVIFIEGYNMYVRVSKKSLCLYIWQTLPNQIQVYAKPDKR